MADEREGAVILEVDGPNAKHAFRNEPGGHRWQRVPPTEKRGRRHTSTVTVAVMDAPPPQDWSFSEREIQWTATRGSGKGGQARNKTSNAVQMRHLPTGITVRVESSREQWKNRQTAYRLLATKIVEWRRSRKGAERDAERKRQVGSGQRGDKVRTIRLQDGVVTDHRTGRTMPAKTYLRGEFAWLRD